MPVHGSTKFSTIMTTTRVVASKRKKTNKNSDLRLIDIGEQCWGGRATEGDLVMEKGVIGKKEMGRKHKSHHIGRNIRIENRDKKGGRSKGRANCPNWLSFRNYFLK